MLDKFLWVEKYRPSDNSEYVFKDETLKSKFDSWIKDGNIPHLILYGPAGTGKTSLVHLLLKELEISDYLILNNSEKTSIDDVREKILKYVPLISMDKFKVVVLEEMEQMSKAAQSALKRIMEDYSDNCRFILTTNNILKVDDAIRSRCQEFKIDTMEQKDVLKKLVFILNNENIKYDANTLMEYYKAYYPDLRKLINSLQQNVINNELRRLINDEINSDTNQQIIKYFMNNQIAEGRKLIIDSLSQEEYINFYSYLADNFKQFANDEESEFEAFSIIRQGMVEHPICADPEIALSGTICKLVLLKKGQK